MAKDKGKTNGKGAAEAEKKEKPVELNDTLLPLFKSAPADRPRAFRALRVGDKLNKFTVTAPIPLTDEEAKELYHITIAELIEKGLVKHMYDNDTDARNVCAEALKNGQLPTEDAVRKAMEESFGKDRTRAVSETKKDARDLKAAKATLGVETNEEAFAMAKRWKAVLAGVDPKDTVAQDKWIAENLK